MAADAPSGARAADRSRAQRSFVFGAAPTQSCARRGIPAQGNRCRRAPRECTRGRAGRPKTRHRFRRGTAFARSETEAPARRESARGYEPVARKPGTASDAERLAHTLIAPLVAL